jgi:hypothetical protein
MARMSGARVFVFSDGGFAQEWAPIIDYVGEENFMLVEVHSETKDFSNDSVATLAMNLSCCILRSSLVKLNNQ